MAAGFMVRVYRENKPIALFKRKEKPMTDASKEPFTIQAGKRYNRRDGGISGVLEQSRWPDKLIDRHNPSHDGNRLYLKNGDHFFGDTKIDLISKYIDPTAYETITNGDFTTDTNWTRTSTAAPVTDEWGPWIGWNGGECAVEGIVNVIIIKNDEPAERENEAKYFGWNDKDADYPIIAYRTKKEPEVREYDVWMSKDGQLFHYKSFASKGSRKAIITTQGDKISARWADE